jgi:hypothetical protein
VGRQAIAAILGVEADWVGVVSTDSPRGMGVGGGKMFEATSA